MQEVITVAVMPLMNLIAQGTVVVALLALLIYAHPLLSFYAVLGFGLAYGVLYVLW